MKRNVFVFTGVLLLPLVLGGCSREWSLFGGNDANFSGAASVFEDYTALESIKTADIAKDLNGSTTTANDLSGAMTTFQTGAAASLTTFDKVTIKNYMMRRDAAQDRILRASENRCGFYQRYLKRLQSDTALGFGGLATALGGAGAIVTGAAEARALAGAAGITSGVGAEVQKDLFANLTSTVIVPGIEKRRSDLLNKIMNNRCYAVDQYTAGMAISDAIAYHNACTLDTGVAEAGLAMKEASSPGLAGLANMSAALAIIASNQSTLSSIAQNIGKPAVPVVGAPPTPPPPPTPITFANNVRTNTGTVVADCTKVYPALWSALQPAKP